MINQWMVDQYKKAKAAWTIILVIVSITGFQLFAQDVKQPVKPETVPAPIVEGQEILSPENIQTVKDLIKELRDARE